MFHAPISSDTASLASVALTTLARYFVDAWYSQAQIVFN